MRLSTTVRVPTRKRRENKPYTDAVALRIPLALIASPINRSAKKSPTTSRICVMIAASASSPGSKAREGSEVEEGCSTSNASCTGTYQKLMEGLSKTADTKGK